MDSFELVTYFIAVLGVIVLCLCVVVASILIYHFCRSVVSVVRCVLNNALTVSNILFVCIIIIIFTKQVSSLLIIWHNNIILLLPLRRTKARHYTQVDCEEGGLSPLGPLPVPSCHPDTAGRLEESDNKKYKKSKAPTSRLPAIKMRLFRQNSAARRKSKIEFEAADFDVPQPKISSRVKKVAFNPRISRSDWDLYDTRGGSEIRDEIEMLLTRNSKDLSIRSKSPAAEEDFKSQYFDALETLSEDEEDSMDVMIRNKDDSDDDYEDIGEENDEKPNKMKKKHQKGLRQLDTKSLPKSVQRRVKAMKNLLVEQKKIEGEMFKDIHKLEGYFYKMHRNKNYNERQKVVEGELCQSTILEEEETEGEEPRQEIEQQGIPGFWLKVLVNSKNLSQIVQVN